MLRMPNQPKRKRGLKKMGNIKEKEAEMLSTKQNSVELTRGSKGEYSWKIKVYFSEIFVRPLQVIEVIDKELKNKYLPK